MKIRVPIATVLIQSALTQVFIFGYFLYKYETIQQATISGAALVGFTSLYGIALGVLLFRRVGRWAGMVIVSFLTSALVTLTFMIYSELGLVVEWYVLFGLLFLAGLMAHGLLYQPQR
ncbi:unnamed protein product, partial [marine sediment metagenome]